MSDEITKFLNFLRLCAVKEYTQELIEETKNTATDHLNNKLDFIKWAEGTAKGEDIDE